MGMGGGFGAVKLFPDTFEHLYAAHPRLRLGVVRGAWVNSGSSLLDLGREESTAEQRDHEGAHAKE